MSNGEEIMVWDKPHGAGVMCNGPEGRGSRGMAGRFYRILKDCRGLERIGDF